jgi:hypothetical protein
MNNKFTKPEAFTDWDGQLERMRAGGRDVKAFFTRRLRTSGYFVPRSPSGKGFCLLATQKNELFLPAFTSEGEFGKWKEPSGGASLLPFDMLHHIVVDDAKLRGVVINPFGKSLVLRRDDLTATENLVTGMTHERADHHTGRMIIAAAKYNPELARTFAAALESSGMNVREAYILITRQEHEPKSHLLFLIDFDGDNKLLFPHVAKAVGPHMKKGANFELLKASSSMLEIARRKAVPVWPVMGKTH